MPLNRGVDDPVGALDAHLAAVEEHEGPLHLQVVLGDADAVAQRHDEREQLPVFEVGDLAVRERRFLVLEPDQVILTVAELEHLPPILNVELALLVHVQDPRVGVRADRDRGLVQRACLEQRVAGCDLVRRDHDLVDGLVVRAQVHVVVGHHFYDPVCEVAQGRVVHSVLDVNQGLRYLARVYSLGYKSDMDFGFFVLFRLSVYVDFFVFLVVAVSYKV